MFSPRRGLLVRVLFFYNAVAWNRDTAITQKLSQRYLSSWFPAVLAIDSMPAKQQQRARLALQSMRQGDPCCRCCQPCRKLPL